MVQRTLYSGMKDKPCKQSCYFVNIYSMSVILVLHKTVNINAKLFWKSLLRYLCSIETSPPPKKPKKAAKQNHTTRFLLLVQNCHFASNRDRLTKDAQGKGIGQDLQLQLLSSIITPTIILFPSSLFSLFLVASLYLIFLFFNGSVEFHWLPTPNNCTHGSLCPQKIP